MSQKGELIGEKRYTLHRSPKANNSQDVEPRINVGDLDVERGQHIVVEAAESHGGSGWASVWECDVYNTRSAITLPKNKIEDGKLLPGDTIFLRVYEAVEGDAKIDESHVEKYDKSDEIDEILAKVNELYEAYLEAKHE